MKCPFCMEEIQEGAVKCKHCGSMLTSIGAGSPMSSPAGSKPIYTDYSQVPWFRKRWFLVLSILLFIPVAAIISLTGDFYYVKKGQLKTYGKSTKWVLIIISIGILVRIFSALR
ncbi:MAG: hypothetical protein C0415_01625 [Thermodesulfovibrio sp.]|nr:hypothetical protein [Thermodesulfovibrio sp.]